MQAGAWAAPLPIYQLRRVKSPTVDICSSRHTGSEALRVSIVAGQLKTALPTIHRASGAHCSYSIAQSLGSTIAVRKRSGFETLLSQPYRPGEEVI